MLRVPFVLLGSLIAIWSTSASPISAPEALRMKRHDYLYRQNHQHFWDVPNIHGVSRDRPEQAEFEEHHHKRGFHLPGCGHGYHPEFPHHFPPGGGWNSDFPVFKPSRKPFGSEGGSQGFNPFGLPGFGNVPGSGWNWPRPEIGGSGGFNPFGRPAFGNGDRNPGKNPDEQKPGSDQPDVPGNAEGNPDIGGSEVGGGPESDNDNPKSGSDSPTVDNETPIPSTENSATSSENPATSSENPATSSENPASSSEDPAFVGDNDQGSDGENGLEGGNAGNQPNIEGSSNRRGSAGIDNLAGSAGDRASGRTGGRNPGSGTSDKSSPTNGVQQPAAGGEELLQTRGQPWTTQRSPMNVLFNENTIPEAPCIRRCQSVNNYDPVCGNDNITYQNRGKFLCAQQCGRVVSEAYAGSCVTTPSPNV